MINFRISISVGKNSLVLRGFASGREIAMLSARKNKDILEIVDVEQKSDPNNAIFKQSALWFYDFEMKFLHELFIRSINWGKRVSCKRCSMARKFPVHERRKFLIFLDLANFADKIGLQKGYFGAEGLLPQINLKELNIIAEQLAKIKPLKKTRVRIWKPKKPKPKRK